MTLNLITLKINNRSINLSLDLRLKEKKIDIRHKLKHFEYEVIYALV